MRNLFSSFLSDTLLSLCSVWCVVWAHSKVMTNSGTGIPRQMTSDVSHYPNPLGISPTAQVLTKRNVKDFPFHPVILFPLVKSDSGDGKVLTANYEVADFRENKGVMHIVPKDQQDKFRKDRKKRNEKPKYSVGRYDENRANMYSSEMYGKEKFPRTVHVGIDLGGPVGTKVYAVADGIVEHAGLNDALGDYGHVIVIKHQIYKTQNETIPVWALYGHLDAQSINRKRSGHPVKKGEVLGRIGDVHENGGWYVNPLINFSHYLFSRSIDSYLTFFFPLLF